MLNVTGMQENGNIEGDDSQEITEPSADLPMPSKTEQSTTENMEVHHHPNVEKKNFKEYFLEFLMIFLAVTMGFLAENIRENLSDTEKGKYYIESLLKNLRDDTSNIRIAINYNLDQVKGIDTLRNISKNNLSDLKVQDSLFYYTTSYLFYANYFKSNDITLVQLRNAGGYRLIKDNKVLDSIAVYETNLNFMQYQFKFVEDDLVKTRDIALQIFDMSYSKKFTIFPSNIRVLATNDIFEINQFYNKCWLTEMGLKGYVQMLKDHQKYLTSLILFLQAKYE